MLSFYMFAAMAQEVERRLGKAEVTGSNPVSSFYFFHSPFYTSVKIIHIFYSYAVVPTVVRLNFFAR